MANSPQQDLTSLPLAALWAARGAKFAPFAGYEMPVTFEGVLAEHVWTRTQAGLFDVSHMGPCFLMLREGLGAPEAHARVAALIERLVPADIAGLAPGQMRYTTLLNADGGVIDDLMIARHPDSAMSGALFIVVNAGGKARDFALIAAAAGDAAVLERADQLCLLALQGPYAAAALAPHAPAAARLGFMEVWTGALFDEPATISRSGYTGEDGFEILLSPASAAKLCDALLADARVKPIGLGARDSLRLEAGLCLYGHDLDETTSPIEAALAWTIQKRRRVAGDFPGAARILQELQTGPARKRVGIRPLERAPAREGTEIYANGARIGVITSGGFGASVNAPISMGYVAADHAKPGARVDLAIRGQMRPAEIAPLPFVAHRYVRKT